MKIYVAASFAERDRAAKMMTTLRDFGHVITHDWTKEDDSALTPNTPEWTNFKEECGRADHRGVMEADALVFLVGAKSKDSFTEFGMAIGRNIPCLVLGAAVNPSVFFGLKNVHRMAGSFEIIAWLEGYAYGKWSKS